MTRPSNDPAEGASPPPPDEAAPSPDAAKPASEPRPAPGSSPRVAPERQVTEGLGAPAGLRESSSLAGRSDADSGASVASGEIERVERVEPPSRAAADSPARGERSERSSGADSRSRSPQAGARVSSARRFRVGHVLNGKYRLEQMIAKGGMGCVYLATQIPLGRKVAVKVLIPQSFDDEFRRRFLLEASTCARLTHRHIVTLHDYGETDDGDLFTAMEFLDGEPLSRVVAREVRLAPERAVLIAIQAARALRSAHRAGVVHRDLKPSNVMLMKDDEVDFDADFVKVLDFGLVKVFEGGRDEDDGDDVDLTRAGTMLGSPRYMAPEQIRCQSVDPRTDIYSLGVILFHMLAGRPPFVGQGSVEILNHHLRTPPPAIADVAPEAECPPELEVIVQRCLSKRPEHRHGSMNELLSELKAAYRLVSDSPFRGETTFGSAPEPRDPSSTTSSGARAAAPSGLPPPERTPSKLEHFLTGEVPAPASRASSMATPPPSADEPSVSEVALLSKRRRAGKQLVLLGLLALLIVVAGFAAVRLTQTRPAPSETAPAEVEVALSSEPSGAEVFFEGERLGVTPVEVRLPRLAAGETRPFSFEAEGHEDAVLPGRLDLEAVQIHATLRPLEDAEGALPTEAPLPPAPPGAAPAPSPEAEPEGGAVAGTSEPEAEPSAAEAETPAAEATPSERPTRRATRSRRRARPRPSAREQPSPARRPAPEAEEEAETEPAPSAPSLALEPPEPESDADAAPVLEPTRRSIVVDEEGDKTVVDDGAVPIVD